ncbi:MAG TPA: hypothetical protein VGD76_07630 [Ramlibacter sp.]
MQSTDADAEPWHVQAARYALLRRLALAMRDRMLVHLEPITVMAEVIERRLQQPVPDTKRITAEMARMHGFARTAVGVNLDIVSWLAPEPDTRGALEAAARDCVALLRSEFGFGGFSLRHEPAGGNHEVSLAAVRTVLPAVLFALGDAAGRPARLTVAGDPAGPVLTVRTEDDPDATGRPAHPSYRRMEWQEAEALALAEGVELASDGLVSTLRFPG